MCNFILSDHRSATTPLLFESLIFFKVTSHGSMEGNLQLSRRKHDCGGQPSDSWRRAFNDVLNLKTNTFRIGPSIELLSK